jgi:hypothetical protein
MTKQEFLDALGEKLKEGMSSAQIISQVRYYEGYIDGEIAKGKTEEEAVEDLGDPILIARNILESPREDEDSIFVSSLQDQEDAYEEGNYQGENQHSEEEVRRAVKEDVPLGDTPSDSESHYRENIHKNAHESRTEEKTSGQNFNRQKHAEAHSSSSYENAGRDHSEDSYNGNIPIHGEEDFHESDDRKTSERRDEDRPDDDTIKTGTGLFHDEYGRFRWDLLGAILAFAIGLTVVIWIVTKIVTALSPVVIVILLVLIGAFLVIRYRS